MTEPVPFSPIKRKAYETAAGKVAEELGYFFGGGSTEMVVAFGELQKTTSRVFVPKQMQEQKEVYENGLAVLRHIMNSKAPSQGQYEARVARRKEVIMSELSAPQLVDLESFGNQIPPIFPKDKFFAEYKKTVQPQVKSLAANLETKLGKALEAFVRKHGENLNTIYNYYSSYFGNPINKLGEAIHVMDGLGNIGDGYKRYAVKERVLATNIVANRNPDDTKTFERMASIISEARDQIDEHNDYRMFRAEYIPMLEEAISDFKADILPLLAEAKKQVSPKKIKR